MHAGLTATPNMVTAKNSAFFVLVLNTTRLHVPQMSEICCYLNSAC
jgi:hypothetical protein